MQTFRQLSLAGFEVAMSAACDRYAYFDGVAGIP